MSESRPEVDRDDRRRGSRQSWTPSFHASNAAIGADDEQLLDLPAVLRERVGGECDGGLPRARHREVRPVWKTRMSRARFSSWNGLELPLEAGSPQGPVPARRARQCQRFR